MSRHPLTAPALLALLALSTASCASRGEGDDQGGGGPPPAKVRLGKARTGAITVEHPLLGQVRSTLHAQLAAGEPGEVQEVTVREGDRVKKGDLLVRIDTSLARARMRAAAAQRRQVGEQREQAERDAERLGQAGKQLVAEQEIEQAQSSEAQLLAREAELSANVQEARAILSRLRVVAPFDGQVKARSVDPGDWVSQGAPVLELVANDSVEILADAPAELTGHIEEGRTATLRRGDQEVPAVVRGVVRALDRTTRTARIRLEPTGEAPWLLPGSTAQVVFAIEHSTDDGAVIVPRDALVLGAVDTRVVRAVDGQARPVKVRVLARSEDEALVTGEALSAEDAVVVRGNERLRPGQPLQVVEGDGA